jgi:hypothetical protein
MADTNRIGIHLVRPPQAQPSKPQQRFIPLNEYSLIFPRSMELKLPLLIAQKPPHPPT